MKGLWNWGVQKASSAIARVEEVVAPTLPPQQVFEKHWNTIIDFYAHTHVTDESDPFAAEDALANSNIMRHLDKMLDLLKDEERQMSRTMTEGDVGPCMTILLQKKIVDNLGALGQADRPQGMMALVINTLQELMEATRPGLLDHHAQITDPLNKLIRCAAAQKGKANVPAGLMHLIETIFMKIRQKPELLEHVVIRAGGEEGSAIREFFMFTTVAANINDPDTTGMRARRAAIECFKLVQDMDLSVFIADTTSFCTDVAQGLANAYSAILQLGEARLNEAEKFGAADYLRHHVGFLSEIGQHLHQPVIMEQLVRQLDEHFFTPVIAASIIDSGHTSNTFGLELLRFLIQQLGPSPILTCLCTCLLGASMEVEPQDAEDSHPVRKVLMQHLQSSDRTVLQASLQLFDVLLNTHEEHVVASLLLRNMPSVPSSGEGSQQFNGILVAHVGEQNVTEKMLKDYHEEVEQQLYRWECHDMQSHTLSSSDGSAPGSFEGTFLRAVLGLLSRLLTLDTDTAVILTGLVARMCQCPEQRFHCFALSLETVDPSSGKSLPSIICQVINDVDELMANDPDITQHQLDAVRNAPDQARSGTVDGTVTAKLQPIVVWQEFIKELVAILQMKSMLFPDLP